MASTGVMGDSGEFRTNRSSGDGGSSGGGGGLIGQAANMFAEGARRRQKLSHEQWMMAGQIEHTKEQGRQTRLNLSASVRAVKATAGIYGKGRHVMRHGDFEVQGNIEPPKATPRPRNASSKNAAVKTVAAAPATSAYNARNPHPKNPFDKATERKQFNEYNTASPSRRSAMSRARSRGAK